MFRPHFNIVFFGGGGGGEGEVSRVNRALEGSILKLIYNKIVALGWFKRQTPFGYFSN